MTDEQKPQAPAPAGGEAAPAAAEGAPKAEGAAARPEGAPAARPEGAPPRREGGGGGGQRREGGGRPGGFGGGGRGREGGPRREGGPGGGPGGPRKGKRSFFRKRKVCRFCAERADHIDYKNADPLRGFVQERGKVLPRRITGTCSRHQRWLITAIKRARNIALLPYTTD